MKRNQCLPEDATHDEPPKNYKRLAGAWLSGISKKPVVNEKQQAQGERETQQTQLAQLPPQQQLQSQPHPADPPSGIITPATAASSKANSKKANKAKKTSHKPSHKGGGVHGSGSSKKGNKFALQKSQAEALIASIPADSMLAFCDGCAKPNPGPCGAGAIVYNTRAQYDDDCRGGGGGGKGGGGSTRYHKYLGQGTNNIAELVAIELVLEHVMKDSTSAGRSLVILTDSGYSMGALVWGHARNQNVALIERVEKLYLQAGERLKSLKLKQVKGHADIRGNEIADELANEAVDTFSSSSSTTTPTSRCE